jgi:D-glycero-D-manno-heptose 1,7-bisphosphate phosphatase
MNKALFLDRDGVINYDPGDYTTSLDEFILLPDILESLATAFNKGYKIIVITNQGGIAKGLYTHETVETMHKFLRQRCQDHHVEITGIYYSPHHPEFGNSLTRKPESLLLERAVAQHKIDVAKSVMIGDRERDVECARRVGVRGILVSANSSILHLVKELD